MVDVDEHLLEAWWETPAVRVARTQARWPRCSVAELFAHLATVLDARDDLAGKVDIVDLCGRMLDIEMDRDGDSDSNMVDTRAIGYAMWAYRQGLSHEVAAEIFGLTADEVRLAAKATSRRDEGLRLHGEGRTVKQIAEYLSLTETTVRKWLTELNLEPNRARGLSPESRETILMLRRQGVGPKKISQRLGLTIDQVKQILYGDRHSGKKAS